LMKNRRAMLLTLGRALGATAALALAGCENSEVGSMPKMRKKKNEMLEELDGPAAKPKRKKGKAG
jgi:hypothetical protein